MKKKATNIENILVIAWARILKKVELGVRTWRGKLTHTYTHTHIY